MKTIISKLHRKLEAAWLKARRYVSAAILTMAAAPAVVSATNSPQALVVKVIDTVVKIFPFVGGFFVVSGVFKLVMAYRNDQPEAQAGAAKDIVIGAVFIAFASFIWAPISQAIVYG